MSQRKRYKKHLEKGARPPKSSYYDKNDEISDSDIDDMNEFYKIMQYKRDRKISDCSIAKMSDGSQQSSSEIQAAIEPQHSEVTNSNNIADAATHSDNYSNQKSDQFNDNKYSMEYYEFGTLPACNYEGTCSSDESISVEILANSSSYITDDVESSEEEDFWFATKENKFSELLNNLSSGNLGKPVDAKFVVSSGEMLYAIEAFASQFSLPVTAMEKLCKMINSFTNSDILPNTLYHIDKFLRSNNKFEFHAVCPNCDIYLRQFEPDERNIFCQVCSSNVTVKGNSVNYFVILDFKQEVQYLIEKYGKYYQTLFVNQELKEADFKDIYDGLEYKKFVNSLSETEKDSYVTSVFNSDGSPVFTSSTYSIWPIQMVLNELPIDVRFNESIKCALWFGKHKPNMKMFLKSFVKKVNTINGEKIACKIDNVIKEIKLYPICCCVDSVARAPMLGMVQFNGYYGCNWCYHTGIAVKHDKRKCIKYPLLDFVPKDRTAIETVRHMHTGLSVGQSVFGVKETSALIELDCFDLIEGFVPDSMHAVFLGVCRQFSRYWFDQTGKPYSLKKQVPNIDKILKKVAVPIQVGRLSRSLREKKFWKSREWENWLLYYSLPILQTVAGFEIYLQHWELLVQSMYILMGESISESDLQHADALLKDFVGKTEELYSQKSMTYNVHQLLHLTKSVANWGPLWAHDGYPFESGNGKIVRMIKSAKGVLHQICRRIEYSTSSSILESYIICHQEESPVIEFVSELRDRYTTKSIKIKRNRYFGKSSIIDDEVANVCNDAMNVKNTVSYQRMVKDNCLFASCKRQTYRSNNCFAQINNGMFIKIIEFVVDEFGGNEKTLCNLIHTENVFAYCQKIKKVVKIDNEKICIDTNDIAFVAVCINTQSAQYISAVPNKQHY